MKTIAFAPLLLFVASAQPASNIVLVAHSGAGDYTKMTPPVIEARRDGMLKAIRVVRGEGQIKISGLPAK